MGQKSFGQVKFVNRFVATQLKSGENLVLHTVISLNKVQKHDRIKNSQDLK